MLRLLVMLIVSLSLAACGDDDDGRASGGFTQHATGDGWTIAYSPTSPSHMTANADGTHSLVFPNDVHGVHYVIKPHGALSRANSIQIAFAVTGDGTLAATEGAVSPRVRLFIQRRGDDLTGNGDMQYYRWWSKAVCELKVPGECAMTVAMNPELWLSVYGLGGETNPGAFDAALAGTYQLGFTFGGQFAGHGVRATSDDPVTFILREYSIR